MPHLNERQRRLLLATEARLLGHGGVRAVAQVAGVSETTVRGCLRAGRSGGAVPRGRVRRGGGGRKSAAALDAVLVPALLALVEPYERGDPESPLRWTTKSLRHLAGELARRGHPVSAPMAGKLAARERLQPAGQRQDAGGRPAPGPGRAVPVHRPAGQGPSGSRRAGDQRGHQEAGTAGPAADGRPRVAPEGRAGAGGGPQLLHRPGCGAGDPVRDLRHHPQHRLGQRRCRSRHVRLCLESIRRWWKVRGCRDYPQASRLLVTADAGGSNSYRYRV
jgi:hypothetical protein